MFTEGMNKEKVEKKASVEPDRSVDIVDDADYPEIGKDEVPENKSSNAEQNQVKLSSNSTDSRMTSRMSRKKRKTFTLGVTKPGQSRGANEDTVKSCSNTPPKKEKESDAGKQQEGQSPEPLNEDVLGRTRTSPLAADQNPVEESCEKAKSESQDKPSGRTLRTRTRGSQDRLSAGPSNRRDSSARQGRKENLRSKSLPLPTEVNSKGGQKNSCVSVAESTPDVSQDSGTQDSLTSSLKTRRKSRRQSQQSPALRKPVKESTLEVINMDTTPLTPLNAANRDKNERTAVGSVVSTTPGASEAVTQENIIPVRSRRSGAKEKSDEIPQQPIQQPETKVNMNTFPHPPRLDGESARKLRRSSRRSKNEGISKEVEAKQESLPAAVCQAHSSPNREPSVAVFEENVAMSASGKEESQESNQSCVSLPDIFIFHEESRDMFDDEDERETEIRENIDEQADHEHLSKMSRNNPPQGDAVHSSKVQNEVVKLCRDDLQEKRAPSSSLQADVVQTSQRSQRDEDTEALIPPTPPCHDMSKTFCAVTTAHGQSKRYPENGTTAQNSPGMTTRLVQSKTSPKVGKMASKSRDTTPIIASFLAPRRESTPGFAGEETVHGESLVMETPAVGSRKRARMSDKMTKDTIVGETPAANLSKHSDMSFAENGGSFPDTDGGFRGVGDGFPVNVSPTPDNLAETPATENPASVHHTSAHYENLVRSPTNDSRSGKKVTSQTVADTPVEVFTIKSSDESEEVIHGVRSHQKSVIYDTSCSEHSDDDELIRRKKPKKDQGLVPFVVNGGDDDDNNDENGDHLFSGKGKMKVKATGDDCDEGEDDDAMCMRNPKKTELLSKLSEKDDSDGSDDDEPISMKKSKKSSKIAIISKGNGDESDDDVIGRRKPTRVLAHISGDDSDDDSENDETIGRRKRKRATRMTGVAQDEEDESDDELIPCSFLHTGAKEPLEEDEEIIMNADGDSMSSQESTASHHLNLTSASSILSSQSEIMNTQQRDMARERLLNLEAQMLELQAVLGSEGGNKSQDESLEEENGEVAMSKDIASDHQRKKTNGGFDCQGKEQSNEKKGRSRDGSRDGTEQAVDGDFNVPEEYQETNAEPCSPKAYLAEPRSPSPPPSLSPRSLRKATRSSVSDSINTVSRMVEDIRKNSSKKSSKISKSQSSDVVSGSPDMVSGSTALDDRSPAVASRSTPSYKPKTARRNSAAYVSDSDSDNDIEDVSSEALKHASRTLGQRTDQEQKINKQKSMTPQSRMNGSVVEKRKSTKRRLENEEVTSGMGSESEGEQETPSSRSRTATLAQSKRMKLSNDSGTSPWKKTTPASTSSRKGISARHELPPGGQTPKMGTPRNLTAGQNSKSGTPRTGTPGQTSKSRTPSQHISATTPRNQQLLHTGQGALSMASPVDVSMRTQHSNSEAITSPNQGSSGKSRMTNGGSPSNTRSISLIATGLNRIELRQVEQLSSRLANCRFASAFNANTTHVIVKTDSNFVCERTLKYFQGIASRAWIVSFQWIQESLSAGKLLPEKNYEVQGDVVNGNNHHGPERSRTWVGPGFLANYDLCCIGPFSGLNKDQLVGLCEMCGASTVQHPSLFPYTRGRSAFIVVEPSLDEDERDYEGLRRKFSVPVISREWILDSVAQYQIQPITDYLLSDYSPEDEEPIIDLDSEED